MVQLSRKRILEWQKIFKEKCGVEYTFIEVTKTANNLVGFFDLLLKIDIRNKKNEKRNVKRSSPKRK